MESIEQKLHRIEERIHSLELQGLVTSSPYLTESDFPSAGLDQIVVHNGTNQVIGYFPATSDGLDSAIGSAGSGDAIWLPACIIGDDHSVPAGVSLIGVGRYVSILTGQITLASGAALVSLSILRTGSSSATAVVVSSGSAFINSCKLSVVLTAGTAYLVSPYGNAYLSSCELVCTVNGANVTPFEGLRNLTYTFDSTLQGWIFSTTQVAYTTGAVGMTVNDASVLAWNGGKLRFTVPSFNTNWKYGTAVIDVSARNFVITQDSVLSYSVAESYTGNSFYGSLIEFTDGTTQAFSDMWTGGPIDDAHIGKTIKKIYIGYLVVNMYNPRTIDFDNVVVTNVGGSTYVHACSGINAPGTYLDGDRAVYDALTAPSQHANDIDVAAGLHHTIGTTTGKAADGGVVNSHINNTSNPHGVTKGQVGLGNVANVLCNLAGTTAPTVNEDSGDGYSAGSLWVDITNKKFYICVDPIAGAAIWRNYAVTVQEIDGSPLVTNVKAIKFTNGSVTDNGDGTVTVNVGGAGGSITMQEQDGTPSISVSTLKVPNGTLTDEGGGVASFDPSASAGISSYGWVSEVNTWSYSSADSPVFVASVNADVTAEISLGMRIKLTQTTVKYFIVVAVGTYSGGATLITLYGGTDYTLANAAISSVYYSPVKAPFGFPMSPLKWTVQYTSGNSQYDSSSLTKDIWYNLNSMSLVIPIGAWRVNYQLTVYRGTANGFRATLSTANNSESDTEFSTGIYLNTQYISSLLCTEKNIILTTKTTYYLNVMAMYSNSNLSLMFHLTPGIIRAVCAYL